MDYSFARDYGLRSSRNMPSQSTDRLGVPNNAGNILLSGSRIETTPGYVDLNSVNVYDRAKHYEPNRPAATTKTSSISPTNPYGWLDHNLAVSRRSMSDMRSEIASARQTGPAKSDVNVTHRNSPDLDIMHNTQTGSHIYANYIRQEQSERYTSRQTANDVDTLNLKETYSSTHARPEPGQTQLGKSMRNETLIEDDIAENPYGWKALGPTSRHPTRDRNGLGQTQLGKSVRNDALVEDDNPYGWQALGPTRRPPIRDSIQPGSPSNQNRNENQPNDIYSTRIHSTANVPSPDKLLSSYKFGDTLMPPKRTVTGSNIGQTMTYDYPYMKQVARPPESRANIDDTNAGSNGWVVMATDHAFMHWMHFMFRKIRSRWTNGGQESQTILPPRDENRRQNNQRRRYVSNKRRHLYKSSYTCPERLCIGTVVLAMLVLAAVLPIFVLITYQQDSPKLGMYKIECSLLQFTFDEALVNKSSPEFVQISQSFCYEIESNANISTDAIGYEGCTVNSIRNDRGDVKLSFSVYLQPPVYISEDEILSSLGLVSEQSTIYLGNYVLSRNIDIQPYTIIDD